MTTELGFQGLKVGCKGGESQSREILVNHTQEILYEPSILVKIYIN